MKTIITFLLAVFLSFNGMSQVWNDKMYGLDSLSNDGGIPLLYQIYNHDDSILYFVGGFYKINDHIANCIAAWNTQDVLTFDNGVEWGGDLHNYILP